MRDLIRRLNALPDRFMAGARKAALQSAEAAAQMARGIVPVDTGELKSGIAHAPAADGAQVTASAPHAAMVEFGTGKMPPRPYMLPSAQAVAAQYFRSAGENVK